MQFCLFILRISHDNVWNKYIWKYNIKSLRQQFFNIHREKEHGTWHSRFVEHTFACSSFIAFIILYVSTQTTFATTHNLCLNCNICLQSAQCLHGMCVQEKINCTITRRCQRFGYYLQVNDLSIIRTFPLIYSHSRLLSPKDTW